MVVLYPAEESAAKCGHLVEDSAAKSESLRRALKCQISNVSAFRTPVHAATAIIGRGVFRVRRAMSFHGK